MIIYNPHQLANKLKLIRNQNGWSQAEVAQRIGVKQATISHFENNPDKTQLVTLFKIITALNIKLSINEQQFTEPANTDSDEAW